MSGAIGVDLDVAMKYTLRQLIVAYDGFLLDRWDHTTTLHAATQALTELVSVIGSKKRPKSVDFGKLHPYRRSRRIIDSSNIEMLKAIV